MFDNVCEVVLSQEPLWLLLCFNELSDATGLRVLQPVTQVELPASMRRARWAAVSLPASLLCPTAASYDKRIALWDIGIPDCDYNFKAR